MALITGIDSNVSLEVGATSKAARVTQYTDAGTLLYPAPIGIYHLPISMGRLTAAIADESLIWSMRNTHATKSVRILEIAICTGFDGTAAATSAQYNIVRFSNATPTGGSAITVIKASNSYNTSIVTDARQDAGAALTVTSIVFETAMASFSNPRQVSATNSFSSKYNTNVYDVFDLAAGEGLGIRIGETAVIGDSISGYVRWMEVS